jgi:hypothetical protein
MFDEATSNEGESGLTSGKPTPTRKSASKTSPKKGKKPAADASEVVYIFYNKAEKTARVLSDKQAADDAANEVVGNKDLELYRATRLEPQVVY